jgi:hypothetical protein
MPAAKSSATSRRRPAAAKPEGNLGLKSLAGHSDLPDMHGEAASRAGRAIWLDESFEGQVGLCEKYAVIPFVQKCAELNTAFFNFRPQLVPRAPVGGFAKKADATKAQDALDTWLGDASGAHEELFATALARAWHDSLHFDNCVATWLKRQAAPCFAELGRCRYRRAPAGELLWWRPGWKEKELQAMSKLLRVDETERLAWVQRYRNNEVLVADPEWNAAHPLLAEEFRVLTRVPGAPTFTVPSLKGLFAACDTYQNLEAGENSLSRLGKRAYEQHKLGFEPKASGIAPTLGKAGSKRITKTRDHLKGLSGGEILVTDFDHEIDWKWLPKDALAADKWKTFFERACVWGGPLAYLLLGTGPQALPLDLLKPLALQRRETVRRFVGPLLSTFAKTPVDVRWGDECFLNQRIFADLLKDATQRGAGSYGTHVDTIYGEGAFDREMDRKAAEKAKYGAKPGFEPHYDPHHANAAGAPVSGGGRKPGTPDPPPA